MRTFVVILRVLVLVLGLIGVAGAGFAVYTLHDLLEAVDRAEARLKAGAGKGPAPREDGPGQAAVREAFRNQERAYVFLAIGSVLGLMGAFMGMFGRTNSAAALMVVAVIGPVVFFPTPILFLLTAGFSAGAALALLASLLAALSKPRPAPAAAVEA